MENHKFIGITAKIFPFKICILLHIFHKSTRGRKVYTSYIIFYGVFRLREINIKISNHREISVMAVIPHHIFTTKRICLNIFFLNDQLSDLVYFIFSAFYYRGFKIRQRMRTSGPKCFFCNVKTFSIHTPIERCSHIPITDM